MKPILLLGLATLLASCGQPKAPDAPATDLAAATAPVEAPAAETPAVETPAAPVDAATMPTDQTTAAQKAELEAAAAKAGMPVTPQTRTSFKCDNDEAIEVRFFPEQGIAVLVRGGENIELNGEPVASGFKYSNGQTSITGKGNELTLQVGMMAPAKCTAA